MIAGKADRDEAKRAQSLLAKHRAKTAFREGGWTKRKSARPIQVLQLSRGVLTLSSPQAVGDMIQRRIVKREEFEALQGEPVVHVKNGKPLTAQGAKLLGVPWPPTE